MSDETTPEGMWDRTKAWADKNRTISGALVGGAAGTIVPGIGTVIGAIVGAGVGFASSKEKSPRMASEQDQSLRVASSGQTNNKPTMEERGKVERTRGATVP